MSDSNYEYVDEESTGQGGLDSTRKKYKEERESKEKEKKLK